MRRSCVLAALSLLSCTGDFESFHVGPAGVGAGCGARCGRLTKPATGCAGPSTCGACSLPNVSAPACNATGDCAPGTCAGGFGDCNKTASDGCEHPIGNDPLNCGACDRLCSTTNV